MKDIQNVAIVLAAGLGNRFKASKPKQFININGKMMFKYSIDAFLQNARTDAVIFCINEKHYDFVQQFCKFRKDLLICCGGTTRMQSCYNALLKAKETFPSCHKVLIHDAARPLITDEFINKCYDALDNHKACSIYQDIAQSIIELNHKNKFRYLNRDNVKLVQTPQGFLFTHLLDAFKKLQSNDLFFDEISLFQHFFPKANISLVKANSLNIKVTTLQDQYIVSSLLKNP